jgi:hypothetical protein
MIRAMSTLAHGAANAPAADPLVTRLEGFVAAFEATAPPPFELAKLDSLRDDLAWLQRRGPRAGLLSPLGRLYHAFEHGVSGDRRRARAARAPRHAAAIASAPTPIPAAASATTQPVAVTRSTTHAATALPDPVTLGDDQRALDRLSLWYGGQYRGAILLNYILGVLSGGLAVSTKLLHEPWERRYGLVEVALILIVAAIYFLGRTPRDAFADRRAQSVSRRWHQRWLEYRLLAERLRYAALLQPFDRGADSTWVRIIHAGRARSWYDHYFLWRWSQRPHPDAGLAPELRDAWCARVSAVLAEQIAYHREAGSRRRRLVHILERIAMAFFVMTAALIGVHAALLWIGVAPAARIEGPWQLQATWVAALAGLFTVLGAALHGILGSTELSKIADNSLELVEQLEALRARLAPLLDARRVDDMQEGVEELCRLVTEEATGWRALLRDKDLPLTQ